MALKSSSSKNSNYSPITIVLFFFFVIIGVILLISLQLRTRSQSLYSQASENPAYLTFDKQEIELSDTSTTFTVSGILTPNGNDVGEVHVRIPFERSKLRLTNITLPSNLPFPGVSTDSSSLSAQPFNADAAVTLANQTGVVSLIFSTRIVTFPENPIPPVTSVVSPLYTLTFERTNDFSMDSYTTLNYAFTQNEQESDSSALVFNVQDGTMITTDTLAEPVEGILVFRGTIASPEPTVTLDPSPSTNPEATPSGEPTPTPTSIIPNAPGWFYLMPENLRGYFEQLYLTVFVFKRYTNLQNLLQYIIPLPTDVVQPTPTPTPSS